MVASVASLMGLGVVMLYSASMGAGLVQKQMIAMSLGLMGCFLAIAVDYRHLKRLSWPLFGLVVILLTLVLVPHIGVKAGGARRWLNLWGFSFQPSDMAKLVWVICLAHYADMNHKTMNEWVPGAVVPGAASCLMLGLVFFEPDYGTTALLAAVSGSLLLMAGSRWWHITPPVLLGIACFAVAVYKDPVRMQRVMSWWDLESTKTTTGYQVYQSIIALGSGGVWGLGLESGRQKLGWVPEHHTDFIFSVIGEEMGLQATLGVVLVFAVFVCSGTYIAWRARDRFGFLISGGLTLLIGLQALINVGVVTGTFPNKGLPLPFISFGGSNLAMMLTAVGIILSVALRAPSDVEDRPRALSDARDRSDVT